MTLCKYYSELFNTFKIGSRIKGPYGQLGTIRDIEHTHGLDHKGCHAPTASVRWDNTQYDQTDVDVSQLFKMKNKYLKVGDRVKDIDSGCKGAVTAFAGFGCNKLTHVDVKWDKGCAEQFVSVRDLVKLKKKEFMKNRKKKRIRT